MSVFEIGDFRRDVREWLEENCPATMRTPVPADELPNGGRRGGPAKNPDTEVWLEARRFSWVHRATISAE